MQNISAIKWGSKTHSMSWNNQVSKIFIISLGPNRGERFQFKKTFEFSFCTVKLTNHSLGTK